MIRSVCLATVNRKLVTDRIRSVAQNGYPRIFTDPQNPGRKLKVQSLYQFHFSASFLSCLSIVKLVLLKPVD